MPSKPARMIYTVRVVLGSNAVDSHRPFSRFEGTPLRSGDQDRLRGFLTYNNDTVRPPGHASRN